MRRVQQTKTYHKRGSIGMELPTAGGKEGLGVKPSGAGQLLRFFFGKTIILTPFR